MTRQVAHNLGAYSSENSLFVTTFLILFSDCSGASMPLSQKNRLRNHMEGVAKFEYTVLSVGDVDVSTLLKTLLTRLLKSVCEFADSV